MFNTISQHPWRSTLWLVAVFSLLHLLVMGQAELTNDEAQYALYGYHLDWSYFDHPPLVGWLNALILPFASSEFALRLWPLLLFITSSLLLYGLTREVFPQEPAWLGFISVAVFQSGVMFQLLAMAMLPDTPLIPIALGAGWLLFRALNGKGTGNWVGLGLLIGLAGLSKYTSVTLVITALLAVIWLGKTRVLLTAGPWLAMSIAAIVILPVLFWNYQHEWISFLYQIGHGMPQRDWEIKRLLVSQIGQMIAYSPGMYLFGVLAIIDALRRGDPGSRFLLSLSLPVLLLFGWNSGYETTLLHWPALGWAALTPLIARWLIHHWQHRAVRIGVGFSAGYSLMLIGLVHALIIMPWNPFPANQHPLTDLVGRQAAAQRAIELRDEMADTPGPEPVLFVGNWSIFSRLAWYAKPSPVQVTDQRFDQSDLWYGSPTQGARGIVVVPHFYHDRPDTSGIARFEKCNMVDKLEALIDKKPATTHYLYACSGYKG